MSLTRYSNIDLIGKPNCISLLDNGKCSRLAIDECQGHQCSFLLSGDARYLSECKAKERLAQLDEQTQQRIARKYYRGYRFWNEEE